MTAPSHSVEAALTVSGIGKSYGQVCVLSDISFQVGRGRVHALVGENGAGKSTLVKIITGIVQHDAGEVRVGTRVVNFKTPIEARASGVSAVYQDPKLFPHLDVAENIFMGAYPKTSLGTIDRRAMYSRAQTALTELGVKIDPFALVASLSMAELQFVEIARALSTDVQLLILDEPTSALTPAEAQQLFNIVRQLRDQGKSVLLITHRLEEVEAIADDITILRDGRHVATCPASALDRAGLVNLMVGRPIDTYFADRKIGVPGADILRVQGLGVRGVFTDVSFTLRAGEIVGMAGLVGAGRSEIAQAIFGMTPPDAGTVFLKGVEIRPSSPAQMLKLGVAYLPEDRDGQGLIMTETIVENVTLPIVSRLARFFMLNHESERQVAEAAVETYQVRTYGVNQVVSALSGGNRQKVAFARWLSTGPAVLILDEPTHGVDIGSKLQIHKIIAELAGSGLAVLLISSDLPEVIAMSDRILVIAEGRLVDEIAHGDATQEAVMQSATRTREEASHALA